MPRAAFLILLAAGIIGAQTTTTAAAHPLAVPSNESTREQLSLAALQGKAVGAAFEWELSHAAPASARLRAGEYEIGCTLTAAEGWYQPDRASLTWHQAPSGSAHLKVYIRDGADGRLVPDLQVQATISGPDERQLLTTTLPFGWYPLLNAYGENVRLVRPGRHRVSITILPAPYRRHDPYNGDRFTDRVTAVVEFEVSDPAFVNSAPASDAETAQLELARAQGNAYSKTVDAMFTQANSGARQESGDYLVVYAVEYAEAFWHYHGGKFQYTAEAEESATTNCHVEIAPVDARTGRFLSGLHVLATLTNSDGKEVATRDEPFMWHPWLYHYGENWRVPHAGRYKLTAHIDPPAYRRFGKEAGRRFAAPAHATFENVTIKTGQK